MTEAPILRVHAHELRDRVPKPFTWIFLSESAAQDLLARGQLLLECLRLQRVFRREVPVDRRRAHSRTPGDLPDRNVESVPSECFSRDGEDLLPIVSRVRSHSASHFRRPRSRFV